jgi:hypothetical protein
MGPGLSMVHANYLVVDDVGTSFNSYILSFPFPSLQNGDQHDDFSYRGK